MLLPTIFILLSSVVNFGTCCCPQKERMSSLLDAAVDLISKAKSENISCIEERNSTLEDVLDCSDLYRRGYNKSGVYGIYPINRLTFRKRIPVYCDMTTEGGGWTVIQRRGNFGRSNDFFNQDWKNYKEGFGDLETDFWFGNDNIFIMTNQRPYSLRFDLEDKNKNRAYALYDNFWIDSEFNKYTLHFSGYRGTAGDSLQTHNNMKFSTKDQDNDSWSGGHCAVKYQNGWWFEGCFGANVNGMYNNATNGISWSKWKGSLEYLPWVEIKIRPRIS